MLAQPIADSLKQELLTSSNELRRIALYRELANVYISTLNYQSAEQHLDSAYRLALHTNNYLLQAEILNTEGDVFRRDEKLILAEHSLKTALKLAKLETDSALLCSVCNNLGIVYRRIEQYELSLHYHRIAEQLSAQTNNHKELATALNSIGIIFGMESKYDAALHFFKKALNAELKASNPLGVAINYNSIAWMNVELGNYEKAEEYYNYSIQVNSNIGNQTGIAICQRDLGTMFLRQKKYEQASKHLETALTYFENTNDTRNYCMTAFEISELYISQGFNTQARNLLLQVSESAEISGLKEILKDTHYRLSTLYEGIGNTSEALKHLQISVIYDDSLQSDKLTRIVTETDAKFKLNESQITIKQLQELNDERKHYISRLYILGSILLVILMVVLRLWMRTNHNRNVLRNLADELADNIKAVNNQKEFIAEQNKLLELKTNELELINATKDKFFSIIAHDLRNPFNALIGFAGLLQDNYDSYNDEERKEMIRTIHAASGNAHRLQENLFAWARAQSGTMQVNPTVFDICEIIRDNIEQIKFRAANKNILTENLCPKHPVLLFADRDMINTVVRNLLGNSLKYTNLGGRIEVSVFSTGDTVLTCIKDNGIGIPDDIRKTMFDLKDKQSRRGTDNEPGSGLGLILVKEFVEKNKGEITLDSTIGFGTTFCFTLPVK